MKKLKEEKVLLYMLLFLLCLFSLLFTIQLNKTMRMMQNLNSIRPQIIIIKQEPKEIFKNKEKEQQEIKESRYGFKEDEIYLMTVALCGSASRDGDGEYDIDYENYDRMDQISLVLGVIMNRVRSPKFPNTVSEVIWAPGQFVVMSQWKNGLPKVSERSLSIVRDWCERYDNWEKVQDIPESHLFFRAHGPGGIENISR